MKEFDNILDECLERLLIRGETLEQCLRRYPQQAVELKPLLETALAAKEAVAVQPRPEFRARASYQFRAALQEKATPKRRFLFGWMPQWATALAIVLVLLLAGGGTVAAASNSMPDSFLYPVKLATEEVQLALTPSQVDKAELCASFADRRIAEIVYMAEQGDAYQIDLITQRLDDDLEMLAVYSAGLGEGEVEMLMKTTMDLAPADAATGGDAAGSEQTDSGQADDSADSAPADTATGGADQADSTPAESSVDEEWALMEGDNAPAETEPVEEGSGWVRNGSDDDQVKLQEAVSGSAADNPAVLRAMLEEASPSVRAALLRAIAVSEAGYQDVLEALGY